MNRLLTAAVIALLSLAGCKKDEAAPAAAPAPTAAPKAAPEKPAEPAKPAGTQVADFPVTVELPAGAVANDPLGAPGFHSEDGSISAMIAKVTPESPKDMESSKKAIEEFAFKKWVKSEKTADGWLLTWVGIGIDMDGKEYENHVFEVVKKIGEDTWRCSGSVKQAAQVDANVKLCASLKAAP
ncbi:MAG: hypothetical protein ACOZQL_00925 [Myxococcota bacterium]